MKTKNGESILLSKGVEKSIVEMLIKIKSKYDTLPDIKIFSQLESINLIFLFEKISKAIPKDNPTIVIGISMGCQYADCSGKI
ncbi:MAG: hypothetical protein RRA63_06575 [Candidatus Calescibacterium sp.]|jgi:hypothetical protein|nr:hypothetical protein [Candidatus Calescibacterium sp.]